MIWFPTWTATDNTDAMNLSRILLSYHFPGKDERSILCAPGRPGQGWPLAPLKGLTALTGPARGDSPTALAFG